MKFLFLKRNKFLKENLNIYLFYIGIFLLPSAFSLAVIFLFVSLVFNTDLQSKNFFKDNFNICFGVGTILMIFSSLVQTINKDYLSQYNLDSGLTWIGLLNWIPFFWCFWGFQPYLNSPEKRKKLGLILLSGTLPVLITGLGQYYLKWYGPFEIINGFIIWYQRPLFEFDGLTGLFSNQNYAGIWLTIVWPFCISSLLDSRKYLLKIISVYFFTFCISLSTILTYSRAAWIGIFVGTLLIFGKRCFNLLRNILIGITLIIIATLHPIFGLNIQRFFGLIIPQSIVLEFSDLQYSRLGIWKSGLLSVFNYPIFGTGAGSFPEIFLAEKGIWKGHAHNLPLELLISYGLPAGIMVLVPILIITYSSIKKIFISSKKNSEIIFDKAWVTSLLIILMSQMVDVQYFDGRISIIFWILISGSRNIVKEYKINS